MSKTKSRHKSTTVAPIPERTRSGAPTGNRNAVKHGLRSFEQGRWPAGASYVPRIVGKIGAGLRAELVRIHGATTIFSEALISTVQTHEARALLIERLLRRNKKHLSVVEQADLLEKIGRARDSRDRVLEKMGLRIRNDDDANPWGIPALPAPETPNAELDGIPDLDAENAPAGRHERHKSGGRR